MILRKTQVLKILFLLAISPLWAGCHVGGQPTSSLEEPSSIITTQIPTIAVPATSTYYSKLSTLVISGLCNNGFIVYLSGSALDQVVCSGSQYQFVVTKNVDAIYPFMVSQAAPGKSPSTPATLFWIRKNSITNPTVDNPASNPFRSGLSTLNLSGGCETGATVSLEGDATASTECTNSRYDFIITKFADQIYNITIRQTDPAANTATIAFQWDKQTLATSPTNPQIVVDTEQIFTITGGSGTYTGTLTVNNSGANFDNTTKTYKAGTIANVTDTLEISDGLGITLQVQIHTAPSTADHFVIPTDSGTGQVHPIGQNLPDPFKVIVADKFGNPVENFQVTFQLMNDGASLVGSSYRSTNALGEATVNVRLHENATRVMVLAKPRFGFLPDVNLTGDTSVQFVAYPQFANTGKLDLNFSVGSNPMKVQAIDYDHDGIKDLAVLNSGEPSLGLLKGLGNGLFHPMTRLQPICTGPTDLAAQDFNGDTFVDFAIACSGSNRIAIIRSQGDGTYLPAVFIDVTMGEELPVAIVAADFNDDGLADVITTSASGSVISLRLGNGNGTFGAPTFYNVGLSPSALIAFDMNNDGHLDLAVLNSSDNTVGVLLNDQHGHFLAMQTFPTGTAPVDLVAADFDGDGFQDLAVANNGDNDVLIYLNDHFASFNVPSSIPVTASPTAVKVVDLNGDSFADLIVSGSQDSELSLLMGRGDGMFDSAPPKAVGANPLALAAADFNGDGHPDIASVSNGNQKVEILVGQGNDTLGMTTALGPSPVATAVADLDQDGVGDLVVVEQGANSIHLYKGNNTGLWQDLGTLVTNSGPKAVLVKDFNNDGAPDIVVSHQNVPNLRVYLNDGTGNFPSSVDYTTGLQPVALAASDLNGDGALDIIVANSGSSTVSILANVGDGTFNSKIDFSVDSQPIGLIIADLNNDTALDIVTANQSGNNVSVLLSNGDLTFQNSAQFEVGNSVNSIVAGYFNNDNFIDIAVANETDSSVSILLGVGDGSLQTKTDFWAGATPSSLRMGDFNGDTRQDLIVGNGTGNSFTILYGGGNGMFNLTDNILTRNAVNSLDVSDVNSDGRVDLLLLDSSLGTLDVMVGH